MELSAEHLTPLQRYLMSLLARPRKGPRRPWLVVEADEVRLEPESQSVHGRACVLAAGKLQTMGWLRARPDGGLELACRVEEAAAWLEATRQPSRPLAELDWQNADLDAVIEEAVRAYLA